MNDYERETKRAAGKRRASGLNTVLIVLIVLFGGLALGLGAALLYLNGRDSAPQDAAPAQIQTPAETGEESGTQRGETEEEARENGTVAGQEPSAPEGNGLEAPAAEPGTPEEPTAEELKSAYAAYLRLLEQEQMAIDAYYWQRGYYGWGDRSPENQARPVVLADFYGDGIPELLYLTEEQPDMIAGLRILTWERGQLRSLCSQSFDYMVAGGVRYYFFQLKESKELWVHISSGDESWTWSYSRFEESADGGLERQVLLRKDREPDYSGKDYAVIETFSQDGREVSAQAYEDALGALEGDTATILMLSAGCGDFAEAFAAREGCPAMTCEEAVAWLRLQLAG